MTLSAQSYPDNSARKTKSEKLKEWRHNHPEKVRASQKSQYEKYKERKRSNARRYYWQNPQKHCERSREWGKINAEKVRDANRQRRLVRFGVDETWFQATLEAQGGKCAICGTKEFKNKSDHNRPAVDHRHNCCPQKRACDKCRRGLLCFQCNTRIAHLENQEWFSSALAYLAKYPNA